MLNVFFEDFIRLQITL